MLKPSLLSTDTTAILLLCGRFGTRQPGIKPLTQSEFHELDGALEARKLTPGSLLDGILKEIPHLDSSGTVSLERLSVLLGRTDVLARALNAWTDAGIWVLSERDREYPQRLRHRLTSAQPPLLYGAGPKEPLEGGGICVVGSRDSPKPALHFAKTLGARCGQEGLTVVSSDMRGIDREAISAALNTGGRVIGVLSDSLEKSIAQRRNRDALANGKLTLVTPFSPDTRFTVANAMRANRYQYALSDAAVIVETRRKGGIWSGADENRNEGWVPAFVRVGETMSPGNMALLHLGSLPITQDDVDSAGSLTDFFFSHSLRHRQGKENVKAAESATVGIGDHPSFDLYSIFLAEFLSMVIRRPLSEREIMNHFDLDRGQARKWLKRAIREGQVKKTGRPVRYGVIAAGD